MDDVVSARVVAGRYRLESVVGTGGAGTVWRAVDQRLERVVAVKELVLSPGGRDDVRARALVEARAAAALPDPGIVRVYDVVEEPSIVYLVLEYVEAPSLADVVRDHGPLSDREAAELADDVLATLSLAHAEGIVHRDVKPSNVLLDDHRPRLADFGIARIADEPHLTSTGLVVGTPAYMAPEQARGEDATPATDRYGLGATLFFATEGQPPFDGDGTLPTVLAVLNDDPRPMRRTGSLADLVRALMSKDPAARPSTAEARAQLTAIVAGSDERGRSPSSSRTEGDVALPAPDGGGPGERHASSPRLAAAVSSRSRTPDPADAGPADADQRSPREPATAVIGAFPTGASPTGASPTDAASSGAAPISGASPDQPAGSPAAATTTDPRPRGRLAILMTAVLIGTLLSAAAGVALSRSGDEAAVAEPPGQVSTVDSPIDTSVAVPAHWVRLSPEQAPYALHHPPGWELTADEGLVELGDPATGVLLRVEWSPTVEDPLSWVGRRSADLVDREGYEHLRVSPTQLGEDAAAVWEYEYESDTGEPRHARDLTVRHGDQYVLAVSLRAPRRQWEETSPLWNPIVASLELGERTS